MKLYFFPAIPALAGLTSAILPWVLALFSSLVITPLLYLKYRFGKWTWTVLGLVILALGGIGAKIAFLLSHSKNQVTYTNKANIGQSSEQNFWQNTWLEASPLSEMELDSTHQILFWCTTRKTLVAWSIDQNKAIASISLPDPCVARPKFLPSTAQLFLALGIHETLRGRLMAFELAPQLTFKLLWEQTFQGHLESPPLIEKANLSNSESNANTGSKVRIYGCAGNAGLYSIAEASGENKIQWQNPIGHCDTTPLLLANSLYSLAQIQNTQTTQFVGLNAETGARENTVSSSFEGMPWGTLQAIDKNSEILHFTTGVGTLELPPQTNEKGWSIAINRKSGQTVWQHALPGLPLTKSLYLPGNIRIKPMVITPIKSVGGKGTIIALSAGTGEELWRWQTKTPVLAQPFVSEVTGEKMISVIDTYGTLNVIDPKIGKIITSPVQLDSGSFSGGIQVGRKTYFTTSGALWISP